jgi:hypothetical protein
MHCGATGRAGGYRQFEDEHAQGWPQARFTGTMAP